MLKDFYRILDKTDTSCSVQFTNAEHEIFLAHFPNHPIVPGFALIDTLAEVFEDTIVHIKKSKFIAHLLPNDIIHCQVKQKNKTKYIVVTKNNNKISEINYETA